MDRASAKKMAGTPKYTLYRHRKVIRLFVDSIEVRRGFFEAIRSDLNIEGLKGLVPTDQYQRLERAWRDIQNAMKSAEGVLAEFREELDGEE